MMINGALTWFQHFSNCYLFHCFLLHLKTFLVTCHGQDLNFHRLYAKVKIIKVNPDEWWLYHITMVICIPKNNSLQNCFVQITKHLVLTTTRRQHMFGLGLVKLNPDPESPFAESWNYKISWAGSHPQGSLSPASGPTQDHTKIK